MCYKQAWPQHKQWHEDNASNIKRYVEMMDIGTIVPENISQPVEDPMEQAPEYYGTIAIAKSKFQAGEICRSKKLLRKAIKLDTRRPEAFDKLSVCYNFSGQRNEANFYFMEAFKRYAFVALTNNFGKVQDIDLSFYVWSGGVCSLAKNYFENSELNKPDWWHHDGMVQRITKMAIGVLKADVMTLPDQIGMVYLLQAFALAGIVRHFHASFDGAEVTIPEDRTHEELVEAYVIFKKATKNIYITSTAAIDSFFESVVLETIRKRHAQAKEQVNSRIAEPSVCQAGTLVVVVGFDLESLLGSKIKAGMVSRDGLQDGRVAVKVDGFSELQLIPPENLVATPFKERDVALICCLGDGYRYKFLRSFTIVFQEGINETLLPFIMGHRKLTVWSGN
ncbi:expressed unknown protein [Seminavis robusta]|uniref:Uncharacterized protein n=1 Tax=Seminavis robusta TaxID=568900 RepID=A0A9N8DCX6_9STRA|nr:expressed unknown protein [Seminavis robusta]|eukprot:Sro96_g049500.1 n/a (393) ;mRNA; f:32172-33350